VSLPTTSRRTRAAAAVALGALVLAGCASQTLGSVTELSPSATPTPSASASPSGSSAATDGTDPALAAFYGQRLAWTACGGSFRCATLTVPVDYAAPAGETIGIAVIKLPASDPAHRLGAMVINPGGPGASGIDYARAARSVFSPALLAAYDVVGFDPRGVQRSAPVKCSTDKKFDELLALDGTPDTVAEETDVLRADKEFSSSCATTPPDLLAHVSTPESARDVDILRAALGDTKLTWFGFSYGTLLCATYADLFPQRVGRMVLDGAVDPSLNIIELNHGQAKAFELALRRFVEDCDRQRDCPLPGGTQAGMNSIASFFRDLDSHPLPTNDPARPLTQALAQGAVVSYLYAPAFGDWDVLRAGLTAAYAGDGSVLLDALDQRNERTSTGHYKSNLTAAYLAVNALDDPTRQTVPQTRVLAQQWSKEAPVLGAYFAWEGVSYTDWPVSSTTAPHELHAKGAAPILVVGTTYDPATPYPWAQALAKQLDSGALLTRVGDGHTGYGKGSSCTDQAVDRYLLAGVVPAVGTVCR
jgi:pimeloyl-ACP methyl ester carboxylesterase